MKPERISQIKRAIETGDICHADIYECLEEIERLNLLMKLPEDLEKRVAEIEEGIEFPTNARDHALVELYRTKDLPFLTTTIRSIMAHIKQLEEMRNKEGRENAIFATAMGEKNAELQAELQTERRKLAVLEAGEPTVVTSDKANVEECGEPLVGGVGATCHFPKGHGGYHGINPAAGQEQP